jgi:hypothetical protein
MTIKTQKLKRTMNIAGVLIWSPWLTAHSGLQNISSNPFYKQKKLFFIVLNYKQKQLIFIMHNLCFNNDNLILLFGWKMFMKMKKRKGRR